MTEALPISAAISALAQAMEIARAFLKQRDKALIQEAVQSLNALLFEAQRNALTTQAEQFAALEREDSLKKRIVQLEHWDAEKERYELKELALGVFAYANKPLMEPAEPAHLICANCYQQKRKSILAQRYEPDGRRTYQDCHACKAVIMVSGPGVRPM